jgi:plasmid maintenance system antidote protein VapI
MAIKIGMEPVHPGGFIRRSVLPDELSMTMAARDLGVGRLALSNQLNEKASLSLGTVLRVKKAFCVKMGRI